MPIIEDGMESLLESGDNTLQIGLVEEVSGEERESSPEQVINHVVEKKLN